MTTSRRSAYLLGSVLASCHVIAYFVITTRPTEGSWGGFLLFLIDLPVSILLLLLSNALRINTGYLLLVGGTLWWFFIGWWIAKLVGLLSRK